MDGLAYVFPGQGSQCIGMGVAMANMFPEARAVFDEVSFAVGWDVYRLCCDGPASRLAQTGYAQPALMAAGLACYAVARPRLPPPLAVAGLSLGEYMAYVAAGVMDVHDAVRLVVERGRLMAQASRSTPSGMVAVMGLDPDVLDVLVAESREYGVCAVSSDNAPLQQVVGGENEALAYFAPLAEYAGAFDVRRLNVEGAYHTTLMADATQAYAEFLDQVSFHSPSVAVVSNVTGAPLNGVRSIRRLLVEHVTHPVRWQTSVEVMVASGIGHFVECGPGKALSMLIQKTASAGVTYPVSCPDSLARAYGWFGLSEKKRMYA